MGVSVERVTVGRESPSAADVLKYAAALIRAFGWNQYTKTHAGSSEQQGYTLHDAIGESCTRLSRAVGDTTSSGKDWRVQDVEGRERNLRTEATSAVATAIRASGFTSDPNSPDALDVQFNDKATDEGQVLAVLDAAAGKAAE
jgi:hypothetical protein